MSDTNRRVDRVLDELRRVRDVGISRADMTVVTGIHPIYVLVAIDYLLALGYNVREYETGRWRLEGCLW